MIRRRNLALVYRNDCTENPLGTLHGNYNLEDVRQEPNSKAAYYPTNDHDVESCCKCLNSTTNGEDKGPNEECPFPSNRVAHTTSRNRRSFGMLVCSIARKRKRNVPSAPSSRTATMVPSSIGPGELKYCLK
jgi:hypothetical protein